MSKSRAQIAEPRLSAALRPHRGIGIGIALAEPSPASKPSGGAAGEVGSDVRLLGDVGCAHGVRGLSLLNNLLAKICLGGVKKFI